MSADETDSVAISPDALRAGNYRPPDRVPDTGEPLVVERDGPPIKIGPIETNPLGKVSERLVRRSNIILGDPNDLDATDWVVGWQSDLDS